MAVLYQELISMELEKGMKALADHNRLMILRMLQQKREYGANLASALDLKVLIQLHRSSGSKL